MQKGFASASDLYIIRNDNAVFKNKPSKAGKRTEIDSDFDYLLDMPLSSLTQEKVAELNKEAKRREYDLQTVRHQTSADMWRADLNELEDHI